MSQTFPSKEMEELRRRFKPGYSVEQAASGHYAVLDPEGKPVRTKSGKLLRMPGTPHGGRQTKNVEAELHKAGVLKSGGQVVRRTMTPEGTRKRIESLKASTAERAKNRQVVADALHARFAAIVEPLGGFEMRGIQADLALIAAKFARERSAENKSGRPLTPDLLVGSIHRVANRNWVEPTYQAIWAEVADYFEAAKDPVETYFDLVREVRGLPEAFVVNEQLALPSGDWPFVVELIKLPLLFIDHTYQRPPDWAFIRRNAASFDERLVGTIDVAQRKRGSVYAILDGQQRYEMMRLLGKSTVWASVYQGLDVEAEARFFLHKNKDKKAMHPYYTFRARLAANDAKAKEIEKIAEKLGYKIAITNSAAGGASENHISAIAALEETHARKTPTRKEALTPTLTLLKQTTYGRKSGQHTNLIRGVGRFFEMYPQNGKPLQEERLAGILSARGPEWLLSAARDEARGSTNQLIDTNLVRVLVTEYNRGLARSDKLPEPKWASARPQP